MSYDFYFVKGNQEHKDSFLRCIPKEYNDVLGTKHFDLSFSTLIMYKPYKLLEKSNKYHLRQITSVQSFFTSAEDAKYCVEMIEFISVLYQFSFLYKEKSGSGKKEEAVFFSLKNNFK